MNVHCNMGIYDPIVIDRSIQDCDGGLEDIFDTYPELDDEYAIELYELED